MKCFITLVINGEFFKMQSKSNLDLIKWIGYII